MEHKFEFDKEYHLEFEIHNTKNTDHLTSAELLDFVEQTTVRAKKDLNASFILASSITCDFFRKTKPTGKITLKYRISHDAVTFSIFQNGKMTARGKAKIAKIINK